MVWSKWKAALAVTVAWAGLTNAQQSPSSAVNAPATPQFMTIQEPGKGPIQCRVLKSWLKDENTEAHEVMSPSGEIMTIIEPRMTGVVPNTHFQPMPVG